jgi:hypothetical protein
VVMDAATALRFRLPKSHDFVIQTNYCNLPQFQPIGHRVQQFRPLCRPIAIAILVFGASQPPLSAQESVTPYISAGGGLTWEQGAYRDEGHGGQIGVGGGAKSGNLGAGLHLTERLKIGVEASFGRPVSRVSQERGYGITEYDRTNDSRVVSGIVAVAVAPPLWMVGGIGVLRSTTIDVVTSSDSFTAVNRRPPTTVERTLVWSSLAGVIGVECEWLEYKRLVLMPSIRAYLSKRDRGTEFTRMGLGPIVLRPSVVMELAF